MAKNITYETPNSLQQRNRASGLIINDKKILLIHRINKGREYYVFPGGGIEKNESPEQTVAREVMEETGLKLISCKFVFEDFNTYTNGNNFCFICKAENGIPILGGPESTYQNKDNQFLLEWHDFDEIKSLNLVPESVKQKLINILNKYR